MKFLCLIILATTLSGGQETGNGNADHELAAGIEYYRSGQFPDAVAAFENSARHQPSAGAFLNLGLAEWQCGHVGAAMLGWEKALWLNPFDGRAVENLRFARTVAQVDAPRLKWFETASTWLPPDVWVWLAGGSLWLVVGIMILPGIFRQKKSSWQQMLMAVGIGIFLFSITANFGVVSRTELGFVLSKNTPLLLTPTRGSEVISTLSAGEPARQLRTREGYVLIRTAYGSGWVERQQLGLVTP